MLGLHVGIGTHLGGGHVGKIEATTRGPEYGRECSVIFTNAVTLSMILRAANTDLTLTLNLSLTPIINPPMT